MFHEEAILLIDIKRNDQTGKFVFELTKQGRQLFSSLSDKKISVVSVAGPSRSGKSFLLNALLSNTSGFHLGHSTNPGTKGIWAWNRPLISDDVAVILVDTEGLYSVARDKQVDSQILGITLLLSSVFVYNNFNVIDEKHLSEVAAVIELARWVRQDSAVPYFLWCLRDFALNTSEYRDSDDYLESVLSMKGVDSGSEKERIRRSFTNFFQERGCMLFVVPVEGKKITQLDKMKYQELRPEFRATVEQFKLRVNARTLPKRIGGAILNGEGYLRLIDEVLSSFNSSALPQIKGAVERLIAATRKDAWEVFKPRTEKTAELAEGGDARLCLDLLRGLYKEIHEFGAKRHDKEIVTDTFEKVLPHFFSKLEDQRRAPTPKFLAGAEEQLSTILSGDPESINSKLKDFFNESKLADKQLPVGFVLRLLERGQRAVMDSALGSAKDAQAEIEELEKDIQAEKELRKQKLDGANSQRALIAELREQLSQAQVDINRKSSEITELRRANNSNSLLKNELSILLEKKDALERQVNNLRRLGETKKLLGKNVIDSAQNMIEDLTGEGAQQLRDFLDYIKTQAIRENDSLKLRVENIKAENSKLKALCGEGTGLAEIERLKEQIKLEQQGSQGHEREKELAMLTMENKCLQVEKETFYYIVKELALAQKGKKNHLANALGMLGPEADPIIAALKENKISF